MVDQNKANLAQAKAQLEKDKANFAYTQLNYDRNARLAQTNAISKDALDNAKNALDQARAQIGVDEASIEQRQAQLEAAQVNLGYTDIVSPVDGTVVSRNVTVGQTVAASFQTPTLFLIATDLTKMQVDTNVSESDIGGIKDGDKAVFTVDAFPKRTFEGAVSQVRQSPQTVQNVVTYDVVVSVDNSDLALKPGMTAANRIITDERTMFCACRARPCAMRRRRGQARRSGRRARGRPHRVWVLRDGKPVRVAVDRRARRRHLYGNRQGRPEGRRPGHHRRATQQQQQQHQRRHACGSDAANGQIDHGGTDHQARTRHADVPRRRRRRACAARRKPHGQGRRIRRHHGRFRLGQIDADGGARLPRPPEQRPLFLRGRRRGELQRARAGAAAQRTPGLRVPELQSFVAHQRPRERGAAAVLCRIRAGRRQHRASSGRARRSSCWA